MKKLILCLCLLTGCSAFFDSLDKTAQGSQWLATIIDVAASGADAYFARHPSLEREQKIEIAVFRARQALAALDAAIATANEVEAARAQALQAYENLRKLLAEMGVLSATPPAGGAETEAPEPQPFDLPSPATVEASL